MSILMGITLSFCLSLIGNLTSGDGFKIMPFLICFAASAVISLVIGFVVPMKKVEGGLNKALNLKERSLPAKLVSTFVSSLIYTPVITLAMTALVRMMVMKASNGHAELPPFIIMFLRSLIISFIAGYFIILIITPIFLKLSMKINGVTPPAGDPPAKK